MTSCTIDWEYYEGYSHCQTGHLPPWISTEADASLSLVPKMDAKFINNNEDDHDDRNNDAQVYLKEKMHVIMRKDI